MKIGIFAKTFPGTDPMTVLLAAKAAGYASVQYNMACSGLPPLPTHVAPTVVRAINRAAQSTGVTIAALSATYNMIHPDPAIRANGLKHLETLIITAKAIGAPLVTLCTGTRDPQDQWRAHPDNATPQAWADLLAEMAKAAEIAERHGVRLGIEPELANVVNTAQKARQLLDEIASPSLRIVLDPANLFETTPDPDRIIRSAIDLLAARIALAHAKDRSPEGSFVTAGKGVINFALFTHHLKAAGVTGDLVTHGLTPDEAPAVAAYLRSLV